MRYGHFDEQNREYVIDRPDVPVSWTNYIGVKDLCAVLSHNAGGYSFYKTAEHHRITRFRQNGVPLDRPGHYVYIRDDETGEFWSVSWQPTGKDLSKAKYECRHGLSYSKFSCDYQGIQASQLIFIPVEDDVELWDVRLKNTTAEPRRLSVFSYVEFSFHHIEIDNQNLQMSLYASGSSYEDGVIEYDFFYEPWTFHYFTASFEPDSYDCLRDSFIGNYRTETDPAAVSAGQCSGSSELGGNHCGALHKRLTLQPGQEERLLFLLGVGPRADGLSMRKKYARPEAVDAAFAGLKTYWQNKLDKFQCATPHPGLDSMINTWTLYQAETCVVWSRFASFVEVGGRTGLGYRDTSQDVMAVPHTNPAKVKQRLEELFHAQVQQGYGLHLFDPEVFKPQENRLPGVKLPTVVPTPSPAEIIHGLKDTCSDDALWIVASVCEYVKETGETAFFDQVIPFADGGEGTVYEHLKRSLDFSGDQIGKDGICLGLRADWNDCLNLGGGESAMVSFLHHWALVNFIEAARFLGRDDGREEVRRHGREGPPGVRGNAVGRRMVPARLHQERDQDRLARERGRQDLPRKQQPGRALRRRPARARAALHGRGRQAPLFAIRHPPAVAGLLPAQRRYRLPHPRLQGHQGKRRHLQPSQPVGDRRRVQARARRPGDEILRFDSALHTRTT